jgi:Rrf2 family protein
MQHERPMSQVTGLRKCGRTPCRGGWSTKSSDSVELSDKLARMRVSAKADYALRALIEIAVRSDGTAVSAEQLGKAQGIPHGFLQAILADLRRADVVVSQRGQSGGWRFARKPETVTVADVIRAVDGPLVSVYGLRPEAVEYDDSAQVLQHVWIAARSSLRGVFEQVTIQDLADGKLPQGVAALTEDEDAWQPH